MQKPLDPMSVQRAETPSAAYVLRRRYGPARHVIAAVTWVTVFNMLFQPAFVLAANLTWDPSGGGGAGSDGVGTWLNTGVWTDLTDPQTWNNATPDNALIGCGAAGGTITLGTVTAGTVTFNAFTGTYTLSGGGLTLNNAMTVNNTAAAISIGTPIGGAGSITVSSGYGSTLTLSVANTYTGGVTINSGWLQIAVAETPGTSGALGKSGTLTLAGGKISGNDGAARTISNNALAITGSVTIGDGAKNGNLTFSNATQSITGSPTIRFAGGAHLFSTGAMALNSDATYIIEQGTVIESGGFALGGSNRNLTVQSGNNANTFTLRGAITSSAANNLVLLGGGLINIGDGTAPVTSAGSAGATGIVVGDTGTVNRPYVTFGAANTFTGGVTVHSGRASFTGANAFSNGVTQDGGFSFFNNATQPFTGVAAISGGTALFYTANTASGGTTVSGTGHVQVFNAAALGTGAITLSGGKISTAYYGTAYTLANATVDITGSTTIGDPLLYAALTFSGATKSINNSPTITLGSSGHILSAGQITLTTGATIQGPGSVTFSGGFSLPGSRTLTIDNAGRSLFATLSGNIALGANVLTLDVTGGVPYAGQSYNPVYLGTTYTASPGTAGNVLLSGIVSGSNGGITKAGTGMLTLNANNTFTGPTRIDGGILTVLTLASGGSASPLGQSANAAANLVINGATLLVAPAGVQTTDRLFTIGSTAAINSSSTTAGNTITFNNTGALAFVTPGTAATLTLMGANTGDNTLTSRLTDNGGGVVGLTKTGFGTWKVNPSSAHAYTGDTMVNAGTLKLDFANLAAPGSGIISSSSALKTVGAVQFIAKNNVVSAQTLAGLTLNAGGTTLTATPTGTGTMTVNLQGVTRNAGATVNFANTGTFQTSTSNEASGILGPWALWNISDFARNNAGSVAAYAAYTAANTENLWTDSGVNYSSTIGTASLSAPRVANTVKFTGTPVLDLVGNTLTANALLATSGALTINRTGAGTLAIPAGSGEIVFGGNQAININVPFSGSGKVIQAGSGLLTIANLPPENANTLRIHNGTAILNGIDLTSNNRSLALYSNGSANTIIVRGALTDATATGKVLTLSGTGYVTWGDATGAITGAGGVNFNDANLIVTVAGGANNYTGPTTLSAGTVYLSAALSSGRYTFGSGSLTLTGGTLWDTVGNAGDWLRRFGNATTINGPVQFVYNILREGYCFLGASTVSSGFSVYSNIPTSNYHSGNGFGFYGPLTLANDITITGLFGLTNSTGSGVNVMFSPAASAITYAADRRITFNNIGYATVQGNLNGGSNTLTLDGSNQGVRLGSCANTEGVATPYSLPLSGTGNLKIDNGTAGGLVWIYNDNDFAGNFTIQSGAVRATAGSVSSVMNAHTILNAGARLELSSNNGCLRLRDLADGTGGGGTIMDSAYGSNPSYLILWDEAGDNASFSGNIGDIGVKTMNVHKWGAGTQTLTGWSTWSTSTVIGGGTLALNFAAATAPGSHIVNPVSPLTIGPGTLSVTGSGSRANWQGFASTGTGFGQGYIAVTSGNNQNATLALGALTRNNLATLDFNTTNTGSGTATIITTTANANGIIGPWATFGGTDFAINDGGNRIVALANNTPTGQNGWSSATANYSFDETVATLSAARTGLTLRYIGTGAKAIDLGSSGANHLQVQAILNSTSDALSVTRSGTSTGELRSTAAGNDLILYSRSGGGNITVSVPISTLTNLIIAGNGSTTLNAASTHTGTTYVNSGTLTLGASDLLPSTAVNINGGTLNMGGNSDTVGAVTLNQGTISNGTLTGTSYTLLDGTVSANLAGAIAVTKNTGITGLMANLGKVTLSGNNTFTGGLTINGGTVLLGHAGALNASTPQAITFAAAATRLQLNGNSPTVASLTGGSAAVATTSIIENTSGTPVTLTVNGTTSPAAYAGLIRDGGSGSLALVKNGTGALTLSATGSSYSGGTTINAGTVRVGANGVQGVAPAGPLGSGDVTVNGGTITSTDGNPRTLFNRLVVGGSGATIGATATYTGGVTFDSSMLSSPAHTINGPITALVATTLTGPITGTPTFVGGSTITLNNPTPTATGAIPLVLGDGVTFSGNGVGGTISVNSQAALGSGAVTINYGGTLQVAGSAAITLTNTITVNAGGTLESNGYSHVFGNTPGSLVVNSMATLSGIGGNSPAWKIAGNTFPSRGVLFLNNNRPMVLNDAAYPTLTGTMVFCQVNSGSAQPINFGALNTGGSARTLGFNAVGTGPTFTGTTLAANLTVAGSGNTGLTGILPMTNSGAGNLGTIATSANSITVNMAPAGVVRVDPSTDGYSGGLTVNNGIFMAYKIGGTGTQKHFGGGTVTVNGGVLRLAINGSPVATDTINFGTAGGVLEAMNPENSGDCTTTFSPAAASTANGPVVLRATNVTGRPEVMAIVGTNFTFNQGAAIQTTHYGTVRFDTALPTLGVGQKIAVPAGTAFGFGSDALFTAGNLGKFSLAANGESLLALDNKTASGGVLIDLTTATGLDADVRLTSASALTLPAGTIIPKGSTIKLAPYVRGMTVSTTDQLGGAGGAYSLGVAAAAVSLDSIGSDLRNGTITISAAQSYTGTTTVQGTVKNALMGGGVTGPTLDVQNAINGSTSITLTRGGALKLTTGNGTMTGATAIGVSGTSTLTVGDTGTKNDNRLNNAAAITLGGTEGAGKLTVYSTTGGAGETVGSLIVDKGYSVVTGSANQRLTFGAGSPYTHNAGGFVHFADLNFAFSSAPSGTGNVSQNGTSGDGEMDAAILVGARVLDGVVNKFVKAASGNLTSVAGKSSLALGNWGDASNSGNILVDAAVSGSVGDGKTINSLRVNNQTIAFGANANVLTIKSGMISFDNNGRIGSAADNGKLKTDSGAFYISTHNTIIYSTIMGDADGNPVPVVASANGWITLEFASTSQNNVNDIYLVDPDNVMNVKGLQKLGADIPGKLYLACRNNAGVELLASVNGGVFKKSLIVPVTGIAAATSPWLVDTFGHSWQGSVNNELYDNMRLTAGTTTPTTFTKNIVGPGTLTLLSGRLKLTADNSGWTGGLTLGGNGAQLLLDSATAAPNAAAPIVVSGAYRGVLNLGTSFAASLDNPFQVGTGSLLLNNWKTTAVTVNGALFGSGGLNLQGVEGSETVLAGVVSLSGAPDTYNFGTATEKQRFVNAQSGITFGVTTLDGTAAYDSSWTQISNGAEGYVRFAPDASGNVNSLIPGAVGPGCLAALRKGSVAADTKAFGYLLTGAASGSSLNGTTTTGSAIVTGMTSTSGYAVGQNISGTGIPGGTTIARILSGTSLLLSANATATGSIADIAISGSGTPYQLPEGKSFVIGSLGAGTDNYVTGGTFGAKVAGTATFLGNAKLYSAEAGDINIHANAAANAATLNLLADTGTTLILGATGNPVVFTPTYGDSGASSAITLMRDRTGNTTLNKIGAGTVLWNNASFKNVAGTSTIEAAKVTLNVNAGTLGGTGTIGGAVSVGAAGTIRPGTTGEGTLTVNDSTLTLAGASSFTYSGGCGKVSFTGTTKVVQYGGTLTVTGTFPSAAATYKLFDGFSSQSGSFTSVALPSAPAGYYWHDFGGGVYFDYATGSIQLDANDTKMWVGNTEPTASGESTSVAQDFNRVMVSSPTSADVSLYKTGVYATTYDRTVTGDLTAPATGSGVAMAAGPQTVSVTVTLDTTTTGAKTGTVVFDNLATTSAGTSQGSDNGNATINVSGTVVDNRTFSATAANLGTVHVGDTASGNTTISTTGANGVRTAVTVPAANDGTVTVAGSATVFDSDEQEDRAVTTAALGSSGPYSGTVTMTPTAEGLAGESVQSFGVAYSGKVFSGNASWTALGGGNWGTGVEANWTDDGFPTIHAAPGTFGGYGGLDRATFGVAQIATVSLNGAAPSLNQMVFAGGTYTVDGTGGGNITMGGTTPKIDVTGGTGHVLSAPVVLGVATECAVASGVTLNLTATVTGAFTLTKTGDGTLAGAGTMAGGLTVNAGILEVTGSSGVRTVGGLTMMAGGALKLTASGTDCGKVVVADGGSVTLNGATLVVTGPIASGTITLIDNQGTGSIGGTFAGLPEGATVLLNGVNFKITYIGGTGNNDVQLRPGKEGTLFLIR